MPAFEELLCQPDRVDAVFFKVITRNDDSGRHGVLIPKEAYSLFPEFSDFQPHSSVNYTHAITTLWRGKGGIVERASNWKHYHRYPERRITALRSAKLNDAEPRTIVLIARHGRASNRYEIHVIYPAEAAYAVVLASFGVAAEEVRPGLFGLKLAWAPGQDAGEQPESLTAFLFEFDRIAAMGFVTTLRAGPTGVGYTFETLMGICENNEMCGDFMGMEIKTYRSEELRMQDSEKVNLFLKEPTWIAGYSLSKLIELAGYNDENGRRALYSTVQIRENSHGLSFAVDRAQGILFLRYRATEIGSWTFDVLEGRLREKHAEAVFVAAQTRGRGAAESFYYRTVTYCRDPAVDAYISLIAQGDAMLEIRAHVGERGRVRNHGSGFRIKKNRIPMLYGSTVQHRDLPPMRAPSA